MSKFNKKNQKYKNFTVTKYKQIDEIGLNLIELEHVNTGATIIKLENDDDENLFSLSFKTWPDSSNGVPHILEHTVLCGSKRFPIKDPFFSMLRRSLNTFMNAMTGADFTCYPASSCVEKDFFNLLDVYMDAVFYPNLKKYSFMQEGHRFEFQNPNDASSPLIYKGVVYNEMKGAMSSADNRLWHKLMEKMLPDLTYCYNSGGEPKDIPNLTHEGLIDFHKKYYNPSRCLFFFYGNNDLKKELDFIEEKVLKNAEKLPKLGILKKQQRFSKPISIKDRYPVAENESTDNKAIISFGYLTCSIDNQLDLHALMLLDNILMGTDAALLKIELLKSKLCKQIDSVLDTEMSEVPYAIICKGCKEQNKDKISNLINQTLENIIKTGLPQKLIDAALHQLEFSRTEISSDFGPYGLTLFFRAALSKQLGIEPENALEIHSLFKALKEKFDDPGFLPYLIKKYFLENTHRIDLVMTPDAHIHQTEEMEERSKLDEIQSHLTPEKIHEIIENSQTLKKYQKEQELQSIECLPKIKISDVPKKIKNYPLTKQKFDNFTLYHHDNFTNDIIYTDIVFDLPKLTLKEIENLTLFTSVLSGLGAGTRSYIDNLEYIQAYTGGISAFLSLNIQVDDVNNSIPIISLQSKALSRNSDKMFSLLKDTITNVHFDDKNRIKELLTQQYVYLENTLPQNAMKYAVNLSQSSLTYPCSLVSKWHGLNYFLNLKNIMKNLDNNLEELIDLFKTIHKKIFSSKNIDLVISSSNKNLDKIKKDNFYSLLDLKFNETSKFIYDFKKPPKTSSAKIIASPVAFTASSYKTVNFLHEDSAYLLVSTNLMENKILHKKIREEGGAYGSGANYSPSSGIFTFNGFRDPHIQRTRDAFKLAIKEISENTITAQELEEAKLGVIQDIDVPISPGSKADAAYTWLRAGKTKEIRQKFRDKILSATIDDIKNAVKKHLLNQIDNAQDAIFSSKELIEKENIKDLKTSNI